MADNTNNTNTGNNNQFITDYIEVMHLDEMGLLQDIDLQLKSIVRSDGIRLSQSTLKDLMLAEQRNVPGMERRRRQIQNQNNKATGTGTQQQSSSEYTYRRRRDSAKDDNLWSFDRRSGKIKAGKMWDNVLEDFEDTLMEGLTGSKHPFDKVFENITDQLMKSVGADRVEDLGQQMGKKLLDQLDKIPYTSIFERTFRDANGNIVRGHQRTTIKGELQEELNTLKGWANSIITGGFNSVTGTLFDGTPVARDFDWFGDVLNLDNILQGSANPSSDSNVEVVAQIDEQTDVVRELHNTVEQGFSSVNDAINANGTQGRQRLGNEFDDPEDIARRRYEEITGQRNQSIPEPEQHVDLTEIGEDLLNRGKGALEDGEGIGSTITDVIGDTLGDGLTDVAGALGETGTELTAVGGELAGLGETAGVVGAAFPELIVAAGLASVALEVISNQINTVISPAIEGIQKFFSALVNSFNRDITLYSKYVELANKRFEDDVKSIREAAYKVIEDSANRVMEVWDRIETTVSATQLTDKAGVQDLWSAYASRLKSEGLASVVSSADIMEKLESVLQQGLQGAVAEEFAYQATLLNSAIPTEDFFQYASTYAAIAANAIKAGMSQQEAIDFATQELQTFANNLLYASREVAGGFTTTLKNSSELFEKAADIALTAHQTSTSQISRVLTTISGAVGAVAPDLASNIVDAVYKAAVGGNSSDITALRSMAGVGASNTAFLQALTQNPQEVLSTLFGNLAQLQNMSSANYMEVAEGLSEVFGMSIKEFARVDFNYLASAISNMSLSSDSLAENMSLLVEGQTTSNDSQMRMQKINEYMIEEGLAYVLDNQVARAIQEHMWEEQLARDIMEAQYSVDFAGSALTMVTGILNTLKGLIDLINPLGWVKKVGNVALTLIESAAEDAELKEILELGKVGEGNAQALYNLTTRNEQLNLATPIVELLGGVSLQRTVQDLMSLSDALLTGNLSMDMYNTGGVGGALSDLWNQAGNAVGYIGDRIGDGLDSVGDWFSNLFGSNDTATTSAMSDYTQTAASSASQNAAKTSSLGLDSVKVASDSLARSTSSVAETASTLSATTGIIGKTISSLISSGDWRKNAGYNPYYYNFGDSGTDYYTPTKSDAETLSELINKSIREYIDEENKLATQLDEKRSTIADDYEGILIERDADILAEVGEIQHRSFYTEAEMVKMVREASDEMLNTEQQTSFEDWLEKFQAQTGIGNLAATLSDYGETLATIEALYQQEEASRQDALTKARDLHEVQFWEDMQQFATKDFVWFMREWERYYIQHEAYTEATNQAYAEAVNLSVRERGEMGDSVLALAEALTDNNIWMEELGDKIKDPVVHTNVLLSKILLVVEAIMQQNNETSIVSVPTALSSLGLGLTNG